MAIVLGIIGEVISNLSRKKSKMINKNQSDTHYGIKVCLYDTVLLEMIMFGCFYMKGNETVEMGHLYVSSVFGIIGLYGVAGSTSKVTKY